MGVFVVTQPPRMDSILVQMPPKLSDAAARYLEERRASLEKWGQYVLNLAEQETFPKAKRA